MLHPGQPHPEPHLHLFPWSSEDPQDDFIWLFSPVLTTPDPHLQCFWGVEWPTGLADRDLRGFEQWQGMLLSLLWAAYRAYRKVCNEVSTKKKSDKKSGTGSVCSPLYMLKFSFLSHQKLLKIRRPENKFYWAANLASKINIWSDCLTSYLQWLELPERENIGK